MNYRVKTDVLAKKEIRFGTFIIDVIGYYAFAYLIGTIIGLLTYIGIDGPYYFIIELGRVGDFVLTIVIYLTYFIIFEIFTQRTLGKFIFKTKVILENGSKPKPADIILRSLCRLIPFEVFSFLGDDGRGWHDSMSDTFVVDSKKFDAKIKMMNDLETLGKPEEDNFSDFRLDK